jgi:hypothetical protein
MVDLAIVLALVVSNALAHAAYVRWRRKSPARRTVKRRSAPRAFTYPTHPSPGFAAGLTEMPEHAIAVRPAGIDW